MLHTPQHLSPGSRVPPPLTLIMLIMSVVMFMVSMIVVTAQSQQPQTVADPSILSVRDECQLALGYDARTADDIAWLTSCIHALTAPTTPPTSPPPVTTTPVTSTPAPPTSTVPPTSTPPTSPAPTSQTTPPTTSSPPVTTTPAPPPPITVCPPFPAFPDANCTGYQHTGVTLKVCHELDGSDDGHLERTQVFDGCLFEGSQSFIRIQAANIVIRNSLIRGAIATHWSMNQDYKNLFVVDTEITTAVENNAPIGDGKNYTCMRCHVHHASTGLGGGSGVTIVDSYVHDMTYTTGAHQAAIGMNNGLNIRIIHNHLDCFRWNVPPGPQGCSAALSLYDEGPLDGVLVQNNLFNAAGEYCAYSGGPTGKNVRFIDNRFGRKYHPRCGNSGPLHSWYPNNVGYFWSGNTYTDGVVITP